MNSLFEKFVINYYGDLPRLLKDIDIEVQYNGLFLCPMHDNYNTPAAKLFKDDTGWVFWCFAEGKMYGTYDILKEIYKINTKVAFRQLWNQLSKAEQEAMRDRFGEYDETAEIQNESSFIKFSKKQIDYKTLLNEICQSYKV